MLKNGQQVVPHSMVQASMPLLLQAIAFQVAFAFKTCASSPALQPVIALLVDGFS
jgi:hypothetical protein